MESEDCASAAGRQSEPTEIEEDTPLSPQQPEPIGAEAVVPVATQQPERIDDAPTVPQQPEPTGARDSSSLSAQHLQRTVSVTAEGILFRSMSVPPTPQTQPAHQPSLPQEAIVGSSSGSSSVWISNATDTTNCPSSSLHGNHARHNDNVHTDGSEGEIGAGPRVPPSVSHGRDAVWSMVPVPSLSVDGGLIPETHIDHPHGSSNGSALSNHRDSRVTTTTNISINCSTTSSDSDHTKASIFGLRSCSILDSDEEERDWMASVKPISDLVETCGRHLKLFVHLQAEEYVLSVIKNYVGIASTLTADMHINAREVLDTSTDGESTGREFPSLMTEEEVQRSELCACLERRHRAVRDYVRSASKITTEQAMAKRILKEYKAAMRKAESYILPDERRSSSRAVSSSVSHGMEVQEGSELPGVKINSHSHLASGSVEEVPMEGTSAEELVSPIHTPSGGVKRERHFEHICHETEKQRNVRKSHQRAALLKIFSLVEGLMCAIRTVYWVMLRCLKTVTGIVNQALEANRVARRAISVTAPLRSAGSSWDYISTIAGAATAASLCAEAAVRDIEEAVQLHRLVEVDLYQAEKELFSMKNETSDGESLVRLVDLGVKCIGKKVSRACRTYLDRAVKDRDFSGPDNSLVFPTTDGIDSPVVSMAFDNIDDGPSDVFQALIRACQGSVNAMRKIVKGLEDFSTAKLGKPRSSDNE